MKKYIVELTSQERSELKDIIKAERMAAHKRRHARILLKAYQDPQATAAISNSKFVILPSILPVPMRCST